MVIKGMKVAVLWAVFFGVLWLCYGMVGQPSHFMAYLFTASLSVLAFVPAMYETTLFMGYVMLNSNDDDEFVDSDGLGWDVTIPTVDGMFFRLYDSRDPHFDPLFVGDLCEVSLGMIHILDRQHFTSAKLASEWAIKKESELVEWDLKRDPEDYGIWN
jgi:hypothetical protein